jgi:hypothetical protein
MLKVTDPLTNREISIYKTANGYGIMRRDMTNKYPNTFLHPDLQWHTVYHNFPDHMIAELVVQRYMDLWSKNAEKSGGCNDNQCVCSINTLMSTGCTYLKKKKKEALHAT